MNETNLMKTIMIEASRKGYRVFRNNVGKGWIGKSIGPFKRKTKVTLDIGDVILKQARRFHAGLHKGSSDLIGFKPVKITHEHVGKTLAVFTALEIKVRSGKTTEEQQRFIDFVNAQGGTALVVKKLEDLPD